MYRLHSQPVADRRRGRGKRPAPRAVRRSLAEQAAGIHNLEQRLRLLDESDQLLVEMSLRHRLSRQRMGELLGVTKGTISRRLRRILNRLHDPIIIAILDPTCTLTPEYKRLAAEYFIHRIPMLQIARRHRLTLYSVRTGLEFVRGWVRGIGSDSR